MSKIGICTIYTGFNYGSALQAYATKQYINSLGVDAKIFKLNGSLIEGRDFRLKKLFVIAIRSLAHLKSGKSVIYSYINSTNNNLTDDVKRLFRDFYNDYICPEYINYGQLKKLGNSDDYIAFICGSDQIWNASSLYIDPFYYLEFAPQNKRIALSPSFGRSSIPEYNLRKILRRVNRIPYLSVREEEGYKIINKELGRNPKVLIDPTFLLSSKEWTNKLLLNKSSEQYVLAYFLDEPNNLAKKKLDELIEEGVKVISIPNKQVQGAMYFDAGPKEFVELVANSRCILTDSFHGVAFSIIFNKIFFAFSRNYGLASDQSSRITSLLKIVDLVDRYDDLSSCDIDYFRVNKILDKERSKVKQYLLTCLREINDGN